MPRTGIEDRRGNPGIKLDVAAQVEPIGHVSGIAKQLRLRGVAFAPLPVLLQGLVELIGILHALHVAAGSRIAVPVPGAADVATRLEDPHPETHAAQAMQHVHASKARPDNHRIESARRVGAVDLRFCWHIPFWSFSCS